MRKHRKRETRKHRKGEIQKQQSTMALLRSMDILALGLRFVGASKRHRSSGTKLCKRVSRFIACFGAHPLVYAKLWHELSQVDAERRLDRFFVMRLLA
jgi:hypothetical protein